MLSAVSIRDIVLIDKLDLAPGPGMTVLSGETGAGKSILLDALSLVLGGRGDASLVREGCDQGKVVVTLDLRNDHPVRQCLLDNEIDHADELIVKRVQYADGRTRGFLNDIPVSAKLMREVGSYLVEIHGQHDDRALVNPATHRMLLDDYGNLASGQGAVALAFEQLASARSALENHRSSLEEARRDEEYARHVVTELRALSAAPGEENQLAEMRQRLMDLEKSVEDVRSVGAVLDGPDSPSAVLSGLLRQITRKNEGESGVFTPLANSLDSALVALDQTLYELEELKRQMDFDPDELERTEERLFALRASARKHNVSCDELSDVLTRYESALSGIERGDEQLAALGKAEAKAAATYHSAAARLSDGRKQAGQRLAKAVESELPDLKLERAAFIVNAVVDNRRESKHGYDVTEFHVRTNPGTQAGPIMKVASGGELSRFLLALKVVLADRGSVPVLIFDEIDSGVGGAVSDAIGKRLARLSERVQVLAVTHAPQVAARATRHLLIEKQLVDGGARSRTNVVELSDGQRREEIARMLAGSTVSDEARAAANRLVDEVSR